MSLLVRELFFGIINLTTTLSFHLSTSLHHARCSCNKGFYYRKFYDMELLPWFAAPFPFSFFLFFFFFLWNENDWVRLYLSLLSNESTCVDATKCVIKLNRVRTMHHLSSSLSSFWKLKSNSSSILFCLSRVQTRVWSNQIRLSSIKCNQGQLSLININLYFI